MHGPLNCIEGKSALSNLKSKELQVFLFEQTMIFSEAVGKKTQFTNPVYIHKAHIQVCISKLPKVHVICYFFVFSIIDFKLYSLY